MQQNKCYDDILHRVTCDKCGSISEYVDIYMGGQIECPVCGNIIRSVFYRPYTCSKTYM